MGLQDGGFRSIVLFRRGERAFLVYGFAKSDPGQHPAGRIEGLPQTADAMLALDNKALVATMKNGTITEITCHG